MLFWCVPLSSVDGNVIPLLFTPCCLPDASVVILNLLFLSERAALMCCLSFVFVSLLALCMPLQRRARWGALLSLGGGRRVHPCPTSEHVRIRRRFSRDLANSDRRSIEQGLAHLHIYVFTALPLCLTFSFVIRSKAWRVATTRSWCC